MNKQRCDEKKANFKKSGKLSGIYVEKKLRNEEGILTTNHPCFIKRNSE